MSAAGHRLLLGQLPLWTLLMALAWAAVGVVMLVVIGPGGAAPLTVTVIAVTFVVAVALGVMGVRMVVRLGPRDVRVPGRAVLPLADIDAVTVTRASGPVPLFVPVVDVRTGRALNRVELDGLSSLGSPKAALRWARILADAAGAGDVPPISAEAHARPRRGA